MSLRYCYDCRQFCGGRDVSIGEHTYCRNCAQQHIDKMEEQIARVKRATQDDRMGRGMDDVDNAYCNGWDDAMDRIAEILEG